MYRLNRLPPLLLAALLILPAAGPLTAADVTVGPQVRIDPVGGPDPAIGSPVMVFRYDGAEVNQWIGLQAFDSGVTRGATVAAGLF